MKRSESPHRTRLHARCGFACPPSLDSLAVPLFRGANHLAANLLAYIKGFSENVREIFLERFKLPEQIAKLDEANLLFLVVKRFAEVDLHPEVVPNHMMGSIFEDLIRRFAEQSNETAGEHFTRARSSA